MSIVLAVAASVVVAFLLSGVYYAVLTPQDPEGTPAPRPVPATVGVEVVRNAVLATGIAVLLDRADVGTVAAALLAGAGLWVVFPVVLLAGSVFHERTSPTRAVLHAGDWLVKLLVMSVLVVVLG